MCWTEFCTSAKSILGIILHVHESPGLPRYRRAWWDRGYPIGGVQFLLSLDSWMHLSYAVEEGGTERGAGLSGCSWDTFQLRGRAGWMDSLSKAVSGYLQT